MREDWIEVLRWWSEALTIQIDRARFDYELTQQR